MNQNGLTSTKIAAYLGTQCGRTFDVVSAASFTRAVGGEVTFVRGEPSLEVLAVVEDKPLTLFIVEGEQWPSLDNVVQVANARLAFADVLREFFETSVTPGIHPTAIIDPSSSIDASAHVGPGVIIGPNVILGAQSTIGAYTVVHEGVQVGSHTEIGAHCVLGGKGFGYERDGDGIPVHFPHLGSVRIGDFVAVGNHVSIARGTLDETVVGDYVKIDDGVFIAHNVRVGEKTLIIAGAEISGSVRIGRECWIAPEVSIRNGITIGDGALVGLGSVVVKDVAAGAVVSGVPAREKE